MIRRTFLALAFTAVFAGIGSAADLKALIVTGQDGSHDWARTTPMLKQMLEETGLFDVDVYISPPKGGDMSKFNPPAFDGYDVVVSAYGYNGDPWPEKVNKAFEKYVREGGGLVIYHAADNAFPQWKEYNEMIGVGGWGDRNEKDGPYLRWRDGKIVRDMTPGPGGSHGPQHEFALEVREPSHPITKGLPSKFMHTADELYNRLRGPAKNVTVLTTSFSPKEKRGTGEHEPTPDDDCLRQRPHLPHRPRPRPETTEKRCLHRDLPTRHRMGRHRQGHAEGTGGYAHGGQIAGEIIPKPCPGKTFTDTTESPSSSAARPRGGGWGEVFCLSAPPASENGLSR